MCNDQRKLNLVYLAFFDFDLLDYGFLVSRHIGILKELTSSVLQKLSIKKICPYCPKIILKCFQYK